jgi:hypothetical protein
MDYRTLNETVHGMNDVCAVEWELRHLVPIDVRYRNVISTPPFAIRPAPSPQSRCQELPEK